MAQADAPIAARRQKAAKPRRDWFADLEFHRDGLIDRKTGRKIGAAELTPMELVKFLVYLAPVFVQSSATRLTGGARVSVTSRPTRRARGT